MATDTTAAERILADRARYVAPGMSTPKLVVAHAERARVTDPDGRTFGRRTRQDNSEPGVLAMVPLAHLDNVSSKVFEIPECARSSVG